MSSEKGGFEGEFGVVENNKIIFHKMKTNLLRFFAVELFFSEISLSKLTRSITSQGLVEKHENFFLCISQ